MSKKLLLILFALSLTRCSFLSDIKTPKLFLKISASTNINPNYTGEPRPLELQIYQLKNDQAFNQASFAQIYTTPQDVLKSEIVLERSLASIFPGQEIVVTMPLAKGTQYIGIIAGFSKSYEAKNKVIYKLDNIIEANLHLKIDGININVSRMTFS